MKRIVVFALVLNAALLGVVAHQLVAIAGGGAVATVNGDVNGDDRLNIADPVFMLNFLYSGGPPPVAFAGGPDHSADIAALQAQVAALSSDLQGRVAELRSEMNINRVRTDVNVGRTNDLFGIVGAISETCCGQ